MDNDVSAKIEKYPCAKNEYYSRFCFFFTMTRLITNWFQKIFIHHAADTKINDRCIIVDKPSDVDAIHCGEIQIPTLKTKDTIIIDKFQTCFIDCTCQCEVKKIFLSKIKLRSFFF
jgi:hypothetical protein